MTVKGIVATVLVTLMVLFLVGFSWDYYHVRQAAAKGEAAFNFLDEAIKARNAQAAKPPTPPIEEKK